MMSVPVELKPTFRAGKSTELFDAEFDRGGAIGGYDVNPDGQIPDDPVRKNQPDRDPSGHRLAGGPAG
jgi:hypothetical protein